MNGPQHYREGELHLSAASHLNKPGGRPVDPNAAAFHLMSAQAHYTAAQVAVAAAQLADRYVGDGDHINEWQAATSATDKTTAEDPWATANTGNFGQAVPGRPYSPTVETALRKLSIAGHVTPADTLASAIPIITGHIAEALIDGENDTVRWARSVADELKRIGLNLHGPIEARAEDISGQPFTYDTGPSLGYDDEPPF